MLVFQRVLIVRFWWKQGLVCGCEIDSSPPWCVGVTLVLGCTCTCKYTLAAIKVPLLLANLIYGLVAPIEWTQFSAVLRFTPLCIIDLWRIMTPLFKQAVHCVLTIFMISWVGETVARFAMHNLNEVCTGPVSMGE